MGAEPEGVFGNCFRTRSNLGRMKNDVGKMIRRNARNPRIKMDDEYWKHSGEGILPYLLDFISYIYN